MAESVHARLSRKAPYSYRGAGNVPPFADDKPIIVYDGVCLLCAGFVRFVVARDAGEQFRFMAAQSSLGQTLFRHYGLDPVAFETILLIVDGRAHGKLDAFTGIMRRIGGAWHVVRLFSALPRPFRDWHYDRIALNRYRLFGRADTCIVPDAGWRGRVLE